MFSHTIKGQPYNMPLLSRFLRESNSEGKGDLLPRLIDYESITKTDGKRTVGFGWFAGGGHILRFVSITVLTTC
jgi:alpha-aminoadipic semialdehyde synthase